MAGLSAEERKKLWARGYQSPLFYIQFFLGKWFSGPPVWAHRGLLAILTRKPEFLLDFGEEVWISKKGRVIKYQWTREELDKLIRHFTYHENPADLESPELPIFTLGEDENGALTITMRVAENTLVMFPRGFAKTTTTKAAMLWRIHYKESLFPVFVGETQTHSESQLGDVKLQLETNERMKLVFGELRPEQRSGLKWAQDVIQTITGVTVAARSRGGQVRGMVVDGQRPDWLVLDDVENKESVSTPEQRGKTESWFLGDLLPATGDMDEEEMGEELDAEVSITMLATLLHQDALAQRNRLSPEFTSIVLGATDKDGAAVWPAKIGLKKLERKKAMYARRGELHLFYLEYFNQIRSPETQLFKPTFFIHRVRTLDECPVRALSVDPAIAEKKESDSCTFGCVGMAPGGTMVVYGCEGFQGISPREQVDKYFEMRRRFKPTKCGMETIAYQKALMHLVKEEMFRRKDYFEIIPIGHYKQSKQERIKGILQPRYAAGYVEHVRVFSELESQLQDFPNGHDDYPDVITQCMMLLDPHAALAGIGGEDDLTKDEYEPLEVVWSAP